MNAADALIVFLPGTEGDPRWLRVIDAVVTQQGTGGGWLAACDLTQLPATATIMLVAPVELTTLHAFAYPDMPPRQGRAAARLAALQESLGAGDTLFAAADENDDPARAHLAAIVARGDMQHWLLWAQHHGLDPDILLPAALLLPEPEQGFVAGTVGDARLLRGNGVALRADDPLAAALVGDAPVVEADAGAVTAAMLAALDEPPLNLRQGEFAKRARLALDPAQIRRIALWAAFIALISLLIALITIVRYNADASRLDAETLAEARKVLPAANDPELVEREIDAQLMQRGSGAHGFAGPTAGLMTAMQGAPGVSLTILSRDQSGMLRARLAAAQAQDINTVLLALQAAGFTITATSSQDPGGRVLADITVQP